jgi:hypothetical protein|tara:strand:- start:4259 stop:4534 length:276 start_codon:yes stop_codon:yes gene_type:complete
MTPDQFQECVSGKKWRFAKSMPSIPHEYTRVSEWASKSDFENAVMCIREHGITEAFYKRKYIYLYVGGYKYWTMGASAHETEIINRAAVNG